MSLKPAVDMKNAQIFYNTQLKVISHNTPIKMQKNNKIKSNNLNS